MDKDFNLFEQEAWKVQMAEKMAAKELGSFWEEKVKPVWLKFKNMYYTTMEQAAKNAGFDSLQDYRNTIEWAKNLSTKMVERVNSVVQQHKELYAPYKSEFDDVQKEYELRKLNYIKGFINQFNQTAVKAISDESLIKRGTEGYAIRCKIDGVQQMGKELPEKINDTINKLTKEGSEKPYTEIWNDYIQNLAYAQYHSTIHNIQDINFGMKR